MAAVAKSPEIVTSWGHYMPFVTGVTLMASGTADVALASKFSVLHGATGSVVNQADGVGETVQFAIDGTTLTIATVNEAGAEAGTSLVGWVAWGIPKA
jgi:hypothetical protein